MRRLDERSRQITREAASGEGDPAGIGVAEVKSIAAEVGIAPEYVQQALTERRIAHSRAGSISPGTNRWATLVLGDEQQTVEVSRLLAAGPAVVFDAMRRVFRSATYDLTLKDTVGADPLQGAVLVFGVPGMTSVSHRFSYAMATSGLKELMVSLHAAPDTTACEVRIRADLQALEDLLRALEVDIRTGGAFALPPSGAARKPVRRDTLEF